MEVRGAEVEELDTRVAKHKGPPWGPIGGGLGGNMGGLLGHFQGLVGLLGILWRFLVRFVVSWGRQVASRGCLGTVSGRLGVVSMPSGRSVGSF